MRRTHVFIVNDDTFPSHLQYLFAGTGAKDKDEDISLLADIKRIKPDDLVIFYIEATTKVKGGFYGIFRIAKQIPLVSQLKREKAFQPNLGKKLIYRTLIEPYEVYSEGVPEWEALDKLPLYATEIQWSLIYRKLKGKRGCTPLLPWEANRLIEMIRNKNKGKILADVKFKGGFDWDKKNRRIVVTSERKNYPLERYFHFDLIKIIYNLQKQKRAYEKYLQLYFVENIGANKDLIPIIGKNVIWFGNEVAAGVGMQKIDILTICERENKKREFRIVELKQQPVTPDIIEQIEYYVNWASQDNGRHLEGAFNWNIQPVIVAPKTTSKILKKVILAFQEYNKKQISLPLLYYEFQLLNTDTIKFQKLKY